MNVRAATLLAALGALGCACAGARPRPPSPPGVRRVVVLPPDNASGAAAPLGPLRAKVEAALRARGVEVVAGPEVDRWLAAHRLRFTGAVSPDAAASAASDLRADALLVTSLEHWVALGMPRVGLGMRLVSSGVAPRVLWSAGVTLAGDEAPGLFGTGIVRSPAVLEDRALGALAASLRRFVATGAAPPPCAREGRFGPQVRYRSDALDGGGPRTVAVLPFVNDTPRRRAGDVVTDAFVRALAATGRFQVVEPGLVREALLGHRIVMEGGVSLDTARVVLGELDADLVLSGWVRTLADDAGGDAPARADFTALLIDRRSEEAVWEVSSYHRGDEGVWAFDFGRVRSGDALACKMIASAAAFAASGPATAPARPVAGEARP